MNTSDVGWLSSQEGTYLLKSGRCQTEVCGRYYYDKCSGFLKAMDMDLGEDVLPIRMAHDHGGWSAASKADWGQKADCVGILKYEPIASSSLCSFELGGADHWAPDKSLPSIVVCKSELVAEIQKPQNKNAYFVLPTLLNGANYTAKDAPVNDVETYKAMLSSSVQDAMGSSNLEGLLGQTAVHPAVCQFLLDNAARDDRSGGINVMSDILSRLKRAGFDFKSQNGFLTLPKVLGREAQRAAVALLRQHLHKMRTLAMESVPATGLSRAGTFSKATHWVNLVFAPSVAIQTHTNVSDAEQTEFQTKVAEEIIFAQYYGALCCAASSAIVGETKAVIYLLPLGTGSFRNSWTLICRGMARAIELLTKEQLSCLDIRAFVGDQKGYIAMANHLDFLRKLKKENQLGPSRGIAPPVSLTLGGQSTKGTVEKLRRKVLECEEKNELSSAEKPELTLPPPSLSTRKRDAVGGFLRRSGSLPVGRLSGFFGSSASNGSLSGNSQKDAAVGSPKVLSKSSSQAELKPSVASRLRSAGPAGIGGFRLHRLSSHSGFSCKDEKSASGVSKAAKQESWSGYSPKDKKIILQEPVSQSNWL